MKITVAGHELDTQIAETWKHVTVAQIADHIAGLGSDRKVKAKGSKQQAIDVLHDVASSMPDVETFTDEAIEAMDPVTRTRLAKSNPSVKAWYAAGKSNGVKAKRVPSTRTEPQTVRFTIDGKPLSDSQNSVSSLAWYSTGRKGGTRIKADALRQLLATHGIVDPSHTTWSVELDNGVTIAAVPIHPKQHVAAAVA